MAEPDSEDSSDCALIIDDGPHDDSNAIEIIDDRDSDVEIVESNENIKNNSLSFFNSSIPSSKSGLTCKVCSRIFPTNNALLNHTRKFNGRSCMILVSNVQQTAKRSNAEDLTLSHEYSVKKKRGRLPNRTTVIMPKLKPIKPVPEAIPLLPHYIPVITKNPNPPPTINIMPSLSQVLIDEIEPEYPCTKCDQIFRHNIGLICHLNSDHNEIPSCENNVEKNSSTKLSKKRKFIKKNKDIKQIEDDEPISDTVNLTLMQDFKKDSILNRMKSYVHSATKDKAICVLCNTNFKNTKKALAHVEDKHITDKIQCGYCNMKFVYELKLRSHMAKRHKVIGVYKCDKCSKMINREECESHMEKCEGKASSVDIKREKNGISN